MLLSFQVIFAQNEVKPAIWYLRDAHSNFTLDSLLKKEAEFTLIKNAGQNWGHDNVPYWFRISLDNKSDKIQSKIVEVGYAYLDEVMLLALKNDQLLYKSPIVGWQIPYITRPIKHYNPIFPVQIAPRSSLTIYLRVYRRTLTVSAPINIWNEDQFHENDANKKIFWGAFGGILFFVFLIGIILFIELRQRTYLYYALYVLMAMIYTFANKGIFLEYYQNGFLGFYGKNIRQVFLNLEIIFILMFIKEYLFPNFRFPLVINIIFKFCVLLNVIAIPLLWTEKYFDNQHLSLPSYVVFLYPLAFLLPVLYSYYLVFYNLFHKIEVTASRIYIIGITPLVVLTLLSIPRNYGIIHNHWLIDTEGTMLFLLFEILILSVGLGIRYKKLRDEKEFQQKLVYEGKLKLLHERENISRDLHDNVGSQLSVISSGLDNIGFLAEKQKVTPEKVEIVNEFVREAIQSLRDTIWATHQEIFTISEFRARVQQYILKYYQSLENCEISINFEENDMNLSSSQALNLFRIIQEALNNAIKYAQASNISINLRVIEKKISLSIIDNGIGFDIEKTKSEPHYGLLNMQKRVNEIEGKLTIKSKICEGTKIEVIL